eukprot:890163-Pelagomonas_calceolata.AAC.1
MAEKLTKKLKNLACSFAIQREQQSSQALPMPFQSGPALRMTLHAGIDINERVGLGFRVRV